MQHPRNKLRSFFDIIFGINAVDHFPGQRQNEVIEFYMHRHWIVLVPTIFVMFSLLGIGIAFDYFVLWPFWYQLSLFQQELAIVLNTALLLLWVHIFFIKLLNYFMTVVIVTNRRILHMQDTAVFNRLTDSVELHNIQDILQFQAGFWSRILNYGSIVVHNAAGNQLFALDHLPHPENHCNHINYVYHKHTSEKDMIKKSPASV